jgi:hypothetical protein
MWFAKFALVVALAVWLGETVFLSLVAAPTLFRNMPSPAEAGQVMSLLFPAYYGIGAACGLVAVVCSLLVWRRMPPPNRAMPIAAVAAALGMVACAYAGAVMLPRTAELRDALRAETVPGAARSEFDRLHRRAVQLNGGVLLLTLAAAGAVAQRLR